VNRKQLKRLDALARAEIVGLTKDKDALQVKLEISELRCEHLALLNEQLRAWLEANVACAVAVGRQMGVPEPRREPVVLASRAVDRAGIAQQDSRNGT
jgi:hypothetical protein